MTNDMLFTYYQYWPTKSKHSNYTQYFVKLTYQHYTIEICKNHKQHVKIRKQG